MVLNIADQVTFFPVNNDFFIAIKELKMNKNVSIAVVLTLSILVVGCSSVKGTVYKQKDGSYKATYASSTERDVRKTIHSDAKVTCKKEAGNDGFVVVEENVESMEDDSKKEGFAAVAGNAVSLTGKYFGAESVRGELVFGCQKS